MRLTIFCNHFRAMSEHKTCEAGCSYDDFKGMGFDKQPCFMKNGIKRPGCDKAEFPTPEEIAAEDAEIHRSMENISKARQAIVAHLGGPWVRNHTPGATGVIDCPVCGAKQSLRFTRAGYNGHIHAGCTTKECVGWME